MEQTQNKATAVKPNVIVLAIAITSLIIVAIAKNMLG
jgi:hypothetical protein